MHCLMNMFSTRGTLILETQCNTNVTARRVNKRTQRVRADLAQAALIGAERQRTRVERTSS